jgi:hypothetical protein
VLRRTTDGGYARAASYEAATCDLPSNVPNRPPLVAVGCVGHLRLIFDQPLRVPYYFPEMFIGVLKVPSVASPKSVLCWFDYHGTLGLVPFVDSLWLEFGCFSDPRHLTVVNELAGSQVAQ